MTLTNGLVVLCPNCGMKRSPEESHCWWCSEDMRKYDTHCYECGQPKKRKPVASEKFRRIYRDVLCG